MTTLRDLLDLYEDRDLIEQDRALPLHEHCPCHSSCWGDAISGERSSPDWAGVSVPWVGERYDAYRILVVGMNFHRYGGLDAHWRICADHIASQRRGSYGKNGRFFAHGAMTYVALAEASMDRAPPPDWQELRSSQLASTWQSCAFLEAVKCSPDRHRSTPYPPMFENCPSLLLAREMEQLRPRVLLLFGDAVRDTVRPLLRERYGLEWGEPGPLERDGCRIGGESVVVFSCTHPSAYRDDWRASCERLAELLEAEPLPSVV